MTKEKFILTSLLVVKTWLIMVKHKSALHYVRTTQKRKVDLLHRLEDTIRMPCVEQWKESSFVSGLGKQTCPSRDVISTICKEKKEHGGKSLSFFRFCISFFNIHYFFLFFSFSHSCQQVEKIERLE